MCPLARSCVRPSIAEDATNAARRQPPSRAGAVHPSRNPTVLPLGGCLPANGVAALLVPSHGIASHLIPSPSHLISPRLIVSFPFFVWNAQLAGLPCPPFSWVSVPPFLRLSGPHLQFC